MEQPQPTRDAGLGLGLSGLPSALLSSLGRIGGGGGGVGLTSSTNFQDFTPDPALETFRRALLARNRARIQAAQDFERVLAADPLPTSRVPRLPAALELPQFQVPTIDQMREHTFAQFVARLKAQALRSRLRLMRPPNLGAPDRLPRDLLGPSVLLGALGPSRSLMPR